MHSVLLLHDHHLSHCKVLVLWFGATVWSYSVTYGPKSVIVVDCHNLAAILILYSVYVLLHCICIQSHDQQLYEHYVLPNNSHILT